MGHMSIDIPQKNNNNEDTIKKHMDKRFDKI